MRLSDQRYTVRLPLPDLMVRGRTHKLYAPVYLDGSLEVPSSATVTVYDASNVAQIATTAATITNGIATYTIASGTFDTSDPVGTGWRVEWAITLDDGTILYPRNDAALVRNGLWPVVTGHDIARRVPGLSSTARVPVTKSVTHQDALDEAWTELQLRLIALGNRPNLIMEPSALRQPHLHLALALIFENQEILSQPVYGEKADEHRAAYEAAFVALAPKYDETDDGKADTRRRPASATVWLCGGDRQAW